MGDERNKRGFTRVNAKVRVRVKTPQSVLIEGRAKDLSLKGVYMTGYSRLPLGTECDVTLVLHGTEQTPPIELTGVVARLDEDGVAIEFTSVDMDSLAPLRSLLMYNASDIDEVEHELDQAVGLKRRPPRHA